MIQNLVAASDVSEGSTHQSSNQSAQLNTSQAPSGSWVSLWLGEAPTTLRQAAKRHLTSEFRLLK